MEDDKAEAVIIELNAVKDVMVENLSNLNLIKEQLIHRIIGKILERDVKINVVLSKSQAMHGVSATYKKHVKNHTCIKIKRLRNIEDNRGIDTLNMDFYYS
jgi:hypothetical protein